MFMEYLYIDVVVAEEAVIKQKMMAQGSEGNASRPKREIWHVPYGHEIFFCRKVQ